MSKIRSSGNTTTEKRFRAFLIQAKVSGWRVQHAVLPGRPDFIFPRQMIAVFVDGCFWHSCPECGHTPSTNKNYWSPKLEENRKRDIRISRKIRRLGWRVIRIWEHEIQHSPFRAVARLKSALLRRCCNIERQQRQADMLTSPARANIPPGRKPERTVSRTCTKNLTAKLYTSGPSKPELRESL